MSTQEQLQAIDQALMELLQERITLMRDLRLTPQPVPHRSEPLVANQATHAALLQQHQIPPHLWEVLMTECAAAAAVNQPVQPTNTQDIRRITVVGGGGVMGQFFCDRFRKAGHQVNVLGRHDWDRVDELLADVDLVILSVPLHLTTQITHKLAPHLSPNTALTDVASVKAPILQAMLTAHSGPVLGLHPMFGPGVDSFLAQKVVVCPGRQDEAFEWFLEAIAQDGGQLVMASAEEHDRIMVIVQAIRHFATLCLGLFLMREGIDLSRSLDFASPLYRMETNMIGRLFAQDPSLCSEIIMASEERCQAIQRLASTCQDIADLFGSGNQAALLKEFDLARNLFSQETERALSESNYLINCLMSMIAAEGAIAP